MMDFSILGFAAKLTELTVAVHVESEKSLTKAAKIVQKEAKKELGNYQGAAGPFVAWAELAGSTKDQRIKLGYTENDPGLRSGETRESIEYTVTMSGFTGQAEIGSNEDKMVWFELGTDKQPPRSALGGALFRKSDQVANLIGASIYGALIGETVRNGAVMIIDGA